MDNHEVILGRKTNYLIIKDDVGKSKPTTRSLPPIDFVYGKADKSKSKEGASYITKAWLHAQKPSSDDSHNPRDFKKLNKKAVMNGLVTVKAH